MIRCDAHFDPVSDVKLHTLECGVLGVPAARDLHRRVGAAATPRRKSGPVLLLWRISPRYHQKRLLPALPVVVHVVRESVVRAPQKTLKGVIQESVTDRVQNDLTIMYSK